MRVYKIVPKIIRSNRLQAEHFGAIEGACTGSACALHEECFRRVVDEVYAKVSVRHKFKGERDACVDSGECSERGCVYDEGVGSEQSGVDLAVCNRAGARRRIAGNEQRCYSERTQSHGHGVCGAACAADKSGADSGYSGKILNKEGKSYFTELHRKEKGYDEAAKVYEELKNKVIHKRGADAC